MSRLRQGAITFIGRRLGFFFPRRAAPPSFSPRSILIVKPCCLGDVLMATATLGALRGRFPAAHLAWVVGSWSRPALATNPKLDELIDGDGLGVGTPFRWASYVGLVRRLRRRRFDLAVVLDRSPRLALLPWLSGVPVRAGLDNLGRGLALTVKVPCPPQRHEAELYLDVVRALSVPVDEPALEFFPTPAETAWAETTVKGDPVAVHPGGGINPGTSLPAKRWPAERFAALIARLLEQGVRVALLGGPSDAEVVAQVKGHLPAQEGLMDFSGQLSLGQMGALLRRGRLFVGNDSGPLHLAVAVGTPVVGLYGPSSPANYGPFDARSSALYAGASCSPCFGPGRTTPDACDRSCLTQISVPQVWEAVQAFL